MSDSDFRLKLTFATSVENLYAQFATEKGVRNWWTELCEMDERVGGHAVFPFPKGDFHAEATITRLDANRCVEWLFTECTHPADSGFVDLHDWKGTKVRFDVKDVDADQSILEFTHQGLVPLECAETCTSLWQSFLGQSLRKYLETGAGDPYRD